MRNGKLKQGADEPKRHGIYNRKRTEALLCKSRKDIARLKATVTGH